MPYKDPERKRQWEREHREQRNAARRKQSVPMPSEHYAAAKPPDPVTTQRITDCWKVLASVAVGIAVLLRVLAGVRIPDHSRAS